MKKMELNLRVTKSEGNLIYTGVARQYRADCQKGVFKIGTSYDPEHPMMRLRMEIIAAETVTGCFFGYPMTTWGAIVFADEQGVVSSMLVKNESLNNFMEAFNQAAAKGLLLSDLQVEARMSARSNAKGKFYAVEFTIGAAGKFTKEIAAFQSALPENLFEELSEVAPKAREALNA